MKALGIIGYHHTGKTTLAVHLIRCLTARGYRVSSIKDIHNEDYRADTPGTNSWQHARAGAGQVIARGRHDAALVMTPSPDLNSMLALLQADFLVIEGMKEAAVPKIVCAETTDQIDELLDGSVFAISGPISAKLDEYRQIPVFCLQRRGEELADLVERVCFPVLPQSDPDCCTACGRTCREMAAAIVRGQASRGACVLDSQAVVTLEVGGREVSIVPFVQKLLRDSIKAFVGNLRDIDPQGEIKITLKG